MRVVTLNVRHGGGSRTTAICEALRAHSADIIVLTEFRENSSGQLIKRALGRCGYEHVASSHPPAKANGVLLASRTAFEQKAARPDVPLGPWRWLECRFDRLTIVGLYFPLGTPKLPFWDYLLSEASSRSEDQILLIGDFNTGKHHIDEAGATFIGPGNLSKLEALGFVDAWRSLHPSGREYTWFSQAGNGFRLDYAFLSRSLAPHLRATTHSEAERKGGATDHAALIVDIDMGA